MTTRVIRNEADREALLRLLKARGLPFTNETVDGERRTSQQNRLMNKWYQEIGEQLGDRTTQQVRAYCKLRFGVPILYADSELFRDTWDRIFRPMEVEQRLEIMLPPIELPITSMFTVKQETQYMDALQMFAAELGVRLTQPQEAA